MDYHHVTYLAQTWGLVLLTLVFVGAVIYALWPGNKAKFKEIAQAPLKDDNDV